VALAEETGTLGVRCIPSVHRFMAERETRIVTINLSGRRWDVPVKCGSLGGKAFSVKAESDRVREVARACSVPAREVARLAEAEAWKAAGRTGE